ncbi:MAG: carbohydrate ABC transporter permease, partial [Gorillibacterium sp.]|nr:carbohydrate ABC transporter permease [Gorillibacterium sp.]
MKTMNRIWTLFRYVTLLIGIFVVLFPPYIIIINAFKTSKELSIKSTLALPDSFLNFSNFAQVFERADLGTAFTNTLIIIVLSLAGNILFGTMFSYAMGRFQFKAQGLVLGAFMLATVIPSITTQVAIFKIIQGFGLYNTLFAPVL